MVYPRRMAASRRGRRAGELVDETGGTRRAVRPIVAHHTYTLLHTREIGILLPNNQRQHRTLRIQEDVLPYALS